MDLLCGNEHGDILGVPGLTPITVQSLKYVTLESNWELAIALNYLLMVLHKPFSFKIMASTLNALGEWLRE